MIRNPTAMKVAVKKDTGAEDLNIEKGKILLRRNIPCHPTGWLPVFPVRYPIDICRSCPPVALKWAKWGQLIVYHYRGS